jgi:hypothetical protein
LVTLAYNCTSCILQFYFMYVYCNSRYSTTAPFLGGFQTRCPLFRVFYEFVLFYFYFIYYFGTLGTLKLHSRYYNNAQQFQNNAKNSNTHCKITVFICAYLLSCVTSELGIYNTMASHYFVCDNIRYVTTPCSSKKKSQNTLKYLRIYQ